jgi:hypothetical protein
MHFIFKIYTFKNTITSLKQWDICVHVLPYMFRSLVLTIFRGIVPVAMLLSALLSSSQLYLGMWLCFCLYCCSVYPPAARSFVYSGTSSGRVHTTATNRNTATWPDKVVTKTTRRTLTLQQEQYP